MTRLTSLAALAISALALFSAPAALAGAADQEKKANAKVAKQVKKLKRQVEQLRRQVEKASNTPGPQGPAGPPGPATGPAGGDLTGTFPNPLIAPNAVGTAEIGDGEVGQGDIGANAVATEQIQNLGITQRDLAGSSVGAIELKASRSVVGPGVSVSAGTTRTATVTCPGLGTAIGGGFAWQSDGPNSIIYSVPEEANSHTWAVRGTVPTGSNTLFAWARCLDR